MASSVRRQLSASLAVALSILFLALAGTFPVSGAPDDEATRQLLAAGDKALGNGRAHYQEALSKYTEALVRSPESERGLYSRAQLLSMTNERKEALADLDTLLALSPDHPHALALRMTLNTQEGHLDNAVADGKRLAAVYRRTDKAAKAAETEAKVRSLASHAAAWHRLGDIMHTPPSQYQPAGANAARKKQYEDCVDLLQAVIQEFSVESVDLRLQRASCALASGNNQVASQEVKFVLTRDSQNLVATALNAKALRGLGALEQAKSEARRCLAIDPEYAPCATVSKLIRSQQRHSKAVEEGLAHHKYEDALKHIQQAFEEENGAPPYTEQLLQWRCDAYVGLRDTAKGVPACEAALGTVGPDGQAAADIRIRIAELYIVDDELDKAEAMATKAKEALRGYGKAEELLGKIQALRRTGARKDYYKILGLKKSASQQDIRRAYRKLAKQYHPDQWRSLDISDAEREKNDRRFRDINEAKEVLTDEEKRKRYDNGEDVMNPHAQANQGGPFYGAPFNFPGGFPGGGFPGGGFPGGFPFRGGPGGGGGGGQQQFFFFRQ